jgi:hypothetical protein
LTLDDLRAKYPHLGFALYAYTPLGNVTLECLTADGTTYKFARPHRGRRHRRGLRRRGRDARGTAEPVARPAVGSSDAIRFCFRLTINLEGTTTLKMLEAMRDTVALMEAGLQHIAEAGDASGDEKMHIARLDADLQPPHIRDMLATMESGINPQDTERNFGEGKMGRWLGWAQAAVVAQGCGSLDDMKAINKRWAS